MQPVYTRGHFYFGQSGHSHVGITELLTVKELAAELRMSLKSNQQGYCKGEIPVQWFGRMVRFDLTQVRRAVERNGPSRLLRLNHSTATKQGAPQAAPFGKTGAGIAEK